MRMSPSLNTSNPAAVDLVAFAHPELLVALDLNDPAILDHQGYRSEADAAQSFPHRSFNLAPKFAPEQTAAFRHCAPQYLVYGFYSLSR
jgi:hypothetical protein